MTTTSTQWQLARDAAERYGRILVPTILGPAAQSLPPVEGATIEWFVRSAYELPFAAAEFTVVLCAQTLQFLDNRPRALAEMHRVLKPGGRVAVSLWCDLRESPYFDALVQAVTRHIGAETAVGLRAAFSLSDLETICALVEGAGYKDLRTTTTQLDLQLPALADFVPKHVSATPMATGFNAASPEKRQAVVEEVSEKLASYDTGERVRIPFRTYLVQAVK